MIYDILKDVMLIRPLELSTFGSTEYRPFGLSTRTQCVDQKHLENFRIVRLIGKQPIIGIWQLQIIPGQIITLIRKNVSINEFSK